MPKSKNDQILKKKRNGGKILFVEDDEFIAELFRQKFVLEGYTPIIAKTAISAVLAINQEKPIAIILDIVLKDSECWMIMEYLLRKKDYQPVPVIILTNYENDEYRKKAKELKADAFIVKSNTTPSKLVEKMEDLIKRRKKAKPYRHPATF